MASCSSCHIAIEPFEEEKKSEVQPWSKEEPFTQESRPSCPAKEAMTNCLYTAQGMFVCQKPVDGVKESVPNSEMAKWVEYGVAKTASPWS